MVFSQDVPAIIDRAELEVLLAKSGLPSKIMTRILQEVEQRRHDQDLMYVCVCCLVVLCVMHVYWLFVRACLFG